MFVISASEAKQLCLNPSAMCFRVRRPTRNSFYGNVLLASLPPVLYHRAMRSLALSVVVLGVAVAAAEKPPEKTPRMRDGRPDLSGNWSYATLTTLERLR